MKILIKGAGDLATGIAVRLYQCGHQIIMTEIEKPLTVRRMVAFSRAVYEKDVIVEGVRGRCAQTSDEAKHIIADGDIAVFVDPEAEIERQIYSS